MITICRKSRIGTKQWDLTWPKHGSVSHTEISEKINNASHSTTRFSLHHLDAAHALGQSMLSILSLCSWKNEILWWPCWASMSVVSIAKLTMARESISMLASVIMLHFISSLHYPKSDPNHKKDNKHWFRVSVTNVQPDKILSLRLFAGCALGLGFLDPGAALTSGCG